MNICVVLNVSVVLNCVECVVLCCVVLNVCVYCVVLRLCCVKRKTTKQGTKL